MRVTGEMIANTATSGAYVGIPYSKLDCQAFVEKVLHDAGMSIINYRGSNHMWRSLVYDRELIADAIDFFPGELVFTLKYDGGEQKRGYHDDMGNAVHVGIYIGGDEVMHSTTGGVQFGKLSRFTHIAKIIDVDYSGADAPENETLTKLQSILFALRQIVQEMEDLTNVIDNNGNS